MVIQTIVQKFFFLQFDMSAQRCQDVSFFLTDKNSGPIGTVRKMSVTSDMDLEEFQSLLHDELVFGHV